ncbi:MAG: cysteine desulfurase family protein [Cellulomonadaceae bacterium]
MLPAAVDALVAELAHTGNASSLHAAGRRARRVVEESRESLGQSLGARPSEILFTAGGTEADNLAMKGLFWARRTGHPERRRILVSSVEHHAVLDPAFWLAEHAGAEVVQLPVDRDGVLDAAALRAELAEHGHAVALVSVMWANNEVGALQPLHEVVRAAHAHGVPVHSDAVQAVGHLPVGFADSGLDAMTVSAHKLGGPVGVGALLARRGLDLTAVLHGGGQERGVRSGTLDTPAIRSFAVAVAEATDHLATEPGRLAALRDELVAGVARIPGATLRGPRPRDTATGAAVVREHDGTPVRLPGNAHFTFEGCEGDSLLFLLDSGGVACSTGSACQAGVPQPSHVLLAMGLSEAEARGALRFSLGRTSTRADVELLLDVLPGAVERARGAGLSSAGVR